MTSKVAFKKNARVRRTKKTRSKIMQLVMPRLTVHRTPRHIYAQLISADNASVLASASTVEKDIRKESPNGGGVEAAKLVGQRIAEKAIKAGVKRVAFDRSGFRFHGRVKSLADAAREGGLEF